MPSAALHDSPSARASGCVSSRPPASASASAASKAGGGGGAAAAAATAIGQGLKAAKAALFLSMAVTTVSPENFSSLRDSTFRPAGPKACRNVIHTNHRPTMQDLSSMCWGNSWACARAPSVSACLCHETQGPHLVSLDEDKASSLSWEDQNPSMV